jgi:hypothetical protein
MQFIFPISFLLVCLLSNAFSAAVEQKNHKEMISAIYANHTAKIATFFKSIAIPVEKKQPHHLRTESVSLPEYDKATLQFTFYSDPACTDVMYYHNLKINRCSRESGLITVQEASHSVWTLLLQVFDTEDCSADPVSENTLPIKKNQCYPYGPDFVRINIMGQPKSAIPGGGNSLVYYNSPQDCAISKNSNLARAIFVLSWPKNVCGRSYDKSGDWKATSCDATSMKFNSYDEQDLVCDSITFSEEVVFEKTQDACTTEYAAQGLLSARSLCLTDSNAP